jgi:hypothetical protein
MIQYSKSASDTKSRVRDLTWMNGRIFVIAAICLFPFAAYHLIAGILLSSAEALKLGIQLSTLTAVLLAIYIIIYSKTKKAVTSNFDECEVDGKIDFTIEQIDEDTMEFTRVTDMESFTIKKTDIKNIRCLKTINVIILTNKKTVDLPKQTDLTEILDFWRS